MVCDRKSRARSSLSRTMRRVAAATNPNLIRTDHSTMMTSVERRTSEFNFHADAADPDKATATQLHLDVDACWPQAKLGWCTKPWNS